MRRKLDKEIETVVRFCYMVEEAHRSLFEKRLNRIFCDSFRECVHICQIHYGHITDVLVYWVKLC